MHWYFLVHLTKPIWCDLNLPTFARYQACLDQLALSTVPTVPSPTQTTQQAWPGQPDWHATANLAGPAWPGPAGPTQPPWLATHFAGVASLANLAGPKIVRRGGMHHLPRWGHWGTLRRPGSIGGSWGHRSKCAETAGQPCQPWPVHLPAGHGCCSFPLQKC